jgi:hypothetical protein
MVPVLRRPPRGVDISVTFGRIAEGDRSATKLISAMTSAMYDLSSEMDARSPEFLPYATRSVCAITLDSVPLRFAREILDKVCIGTAVQNFCRSPHDPPSVETPSQVESLLCRHTSHDEVHQKRHRKRPDRNTARSLELHLLSRYR